MSRTLTVEGLLAGTSGFSLSDWLLDGPAGWYLDHLWGSIQATQRSPLQSQEQVWARIRRLCAGTAIERDLGLAKISSYRDYVKKIPVRDYAFFEPYVKRMLTGERNVLFRGETKCYLVTSGTSGFNSKVIPCNEATAAAFHALQANVIAVGYKGPLRIPLSARKFIYGSKPVIEHVNGIPKGYVSGVLAVDMPGFIRRRIVPSEKTLLIDDWAQKIDAIAREVANADIRAVAAVPSYFINIAKDVMARLGVSTLSEIWPNLDLMLYSGTAIANYQTVIDGLAGKPLHYQGAYLSTEAPLGFQMEPSRHRTAMHFHLGSILFSFNDVDSPDGPALGIDELKVGGEYLVNTGTPNGIVQYAMKDYVKVTSVHPTVEFEVQGRYGSAINIAAEKVSHNEINQAVARMQERTGLAVEHFFVYPSENGNGNPCYEWVFAMKNMESNLEARLAEAIDSSLMEVALDYEEARMDNGFIDPPTVRVISAEVTRDYFLNNSMRGQLKMKTAFKSRDEFSAFAASLLPERA